MRIEAFCPDVICSEGEIKWILSRPSFLIHRKNIIEIHFTNTYYIYGRVVQEKKSLLTKKKIFPTDLTYSSPRIVIIKGFSSFRLLLLDMENQRGCWAALIPIFIRPGQRAKDGRSAVLLCFTLLEIINFEQIQARELEFIWGCVVLLQATNWLLPAHSVPI